MEVFFNLYIELGGDIWVKWIRKIICTVHAIDPIYLLCGGAVMGIFRKLRV